MSAEKRTSEVSVAEARPTTPAPDYDKSIEFLRWLRPGGPWVLVAIANEGGGIECRTLDDEAGARAFLERHGATRNLYYALNPLLRSVSKKPSREDVRELAWLHVDVDPEPGKPLAAEQERILAALRSPPNLPPPSCIVFSGGGYQALWRLQEPVALNGQLDACDDAARYNMQLEALLGGDQCHNVDRILRLPGTVNRPDSKKLAKGRQPALAVVIELRDDAHLISRFVKTPDVGATAGKSAAAAKRAPIGPARSVQSLDELPKGCSDYLKMVIAQGCDPDNPSRWPSRSECLWWVVCELVRQGTTDDVILGIITDPGWGISGHVLAQGRNAHRTALRQIERARDHAVDPRLAELNEQFFVVGNWGGKCRVAQESWDPGLKRSHLTKQSFPDFANFYCNQQVAWQVPTKNGGTTTASAPLGKWWLTHARRRQYERLAFAPGRELPPEIYNLWQGFACEPMPGSCQLYLDHVFKNICRSQRAHYDYLLNWMAAAVQRPDGPGHVAVVLRGRQGVGKGVFASEFGKLFGRHYLHVSNASHLVGNFNAHLRDCVVLFADEAFFAGDPRHRRLLKSLVTEEFLVVEGKGLDAEQSPNFLHIIMASNETWVVPAEHDDRRYLVLDVGDDHAQDSAYFKAIADQMNAGGREALLHELMHRDLSGFEVRCRPVTDALLEQKELSVDPLDEWILLLLEDGELPNNERDGAPNLAASTGKVGLYDDAQRRVPRLKLVGSIKLGKHLRGWKATNHKPGARRFWEFPPLPEMRRRWEAKYGPRDWSGGIDAGWQPTEVRPWWDCPF